MAECSYTKIAEVDECKRWTSAALDVSREGGALVIREEGVYHFPDISNLVRFEIKNLDIGVVGPHGETIPFVVSAVRQGVLDAGKLRPLLVDAHMDNEKFGGIRGGSHYLEVQNKIKECLGNTGVVLDDQEYKQAFSCLADLCRGDTTFFLRAMSYLFSDFSAIINMESEGILNWTGDAVDEYFDEYATTRPGNLSSWPAGDFSPKPFGDVVTDFKPNLYFFDGDFIGVNNDMRGWLGLLSTSRSAHKKALELEKGVFEGMEAEISRGSEDNRLYTISLDKDWVRYPKMFIKSFMEKFYFRLLGR